MLISSSILQQAWVEISLGPDEEPMNLGKDTDCVGMMERMVHVEELCQKFVH